MLTARTDVSGGSTTWEINTKRPWIVFLSSEHDGYRKSNMMATGSGMVAVTTGEYGVALMTAGDTGMVAMTIGDSGGYIMNDAFIPHHTHS